MTLFSSLPTRILAQKPEEAQKQSLNGMSTLQGALSAIRQGFVQAHPTVAGQKHSQHCRSGTDGYALK